MSTANHALNDLRRRAALGVYKHTREQLYARYRLRITAAEYLGLCAAIRRDFARLAPEPSHEPGRFLLTYPYCRREVRFIYELASRLIVTALPPAGAASEPVGTGHHTTPSGRRRKTHGPCRPPKGPKYPPDWAEEWDQ